MPLHPAQFEAIKSTIQPVLAKRGCIAFAVLVGSQATGGAHAGSDGDIADARLAMRALVAQSNTVSS